MPGMYLFGAKYEGLQARASYDYFAASLLTTFQLITAEDYAEVMHDAMYGVGR